MTDFNILLLSCASVVLLLGIVSGLLKSRLLVSEPMVAIAGGVVLGPLVLNVLNLEAFGDPHAILEQVARLTVAVAVISASVRLPRTFFSGSRRIGPLLALGPGMLAMWSVSSLCVWLILGMDPWRAILIGAVITPTDPVLASSIVTGRLAEAALPQRVRDLLSGESGANDGLGYLFVWLPLLVLIHPLNEALATWLTETLLWEVIGAVAFGIALGYIAAKALRWAEATEVLGENSILTMTLAMAFTAVAGVKLLGSDGILAAFAAGYVFRLNTRDRTDEENELFQEASKRFFELPVFVLFGATLPLQGMLELGWPLLGFVLAVLLLRRLPAFFGLSYAIPQTRNLRERLFVSWFGPVGVAAIFYALLALRHGADVLVWHSTAAVVLASAVVHGVSATPMTRALGRAEGAGGEVDEAAPHPAHDAQTR